MEFKLKDGFILGVATSAMQIEGGDCRSSWNDWYDKNMIKDGSDPSRATDHYNRWKEDIDHMVNMGIKAYRFSIEWARVFPSENSVDEAVIDHYKEEMIYLRDKGVALLLTIHHFSNPMWFEKKGGFLIRENIKYYLEFVSLVVDSFGDLISEYITINEPNVYAMNSFWTGFWPPGIKSLKKALAVMSNLSVSHIEAYKLIHKMGKQKGYENIRVSFANHLRAFEPRNPYNPWHHFWSLLMKRFFQDSLTKACCLGRFSWPLKGSSSIEKGEYCDFIAVNYYSRSTISGMENGVDPKAPKNDLGWEICPKGLHSCLEYAYRILARPIYITENGVCDNDDSFRCLFIYEHLREIASSDLPIKGYYHWCFCDNFELVEGESARFGLVHVDFGTQKRTIKISGNFYSDIIANGGVTEEGFELFVKGQKYHL